MASQMLSQSHQSTAAGELPGTWKLAAGRAITLQPREVGVLKVAHGRLWVTFDGPHQGPRNDLGDHILGAGAKVRLHAGQRVVAEAWNGGCPAYFSWDPLTAPSPNVPTRQAMVLQPLADLRRAAAMGVGAAARLAAGVARLALDAVTIPGWHGPSLPSTNSSATKSWT